VNEHVLLTGRVLRTGHRVLDVAHVRHQRPALQLRRIVPREDEDGDAVVMVAAPAAGGSLGLSQPVPISLLGHGSQFRGELGVSPDASHDAQNLALPRW
jgi:hypothetical protein